MSEGRADTLTWAASALARVLDLRAEDLRADSPLTDLGADSIARIQWADVAEEVVAAETGATVHVTDEAITGAATLGDLAAHLAALLPTAPEQAPTSSATETGHPVVAEVRP